MKSLALALSGWIVALGLWAFTASAQSPSPLFVGCVTTTPRSTATTIGLASPTATLNPIFTTATALAVRPAPPSPTSEEALARYRVIAPNGMNLRASPNANAPIVGYLLFGQVVEIGQVVQAGGLIWGATQNGFVALKGNGQVFLQPVK